MENYHKSVLTTEAVEGLKLKPNGTYIDATFGGGGHTKAILQAEPTCKVIAIDWDKVAIESNAPTLEKQFGSRIKIVWGNFARLHFILKKEKIEHVDGILADFGTSQHQIQTKKGFSFTHDSPLDMRMSPSHQQITAEKIINSFPEKELAKIFFDLAEEPKSRSFARAIVQERKKKPFKTTAQLAQFIKSLTKTHYNKPSRVHPATKIFQALRIFVNKELENIEIFLKAAIKALNPGGRIVCISFHSLEDRIVKRRFRDSPEELIIITKKPITPTPLEIDENRSSRSAKMRIGEKIS